MRSKDLWYLTRLIRLVNDEAVVRMGIGDINTLDASHVVCIHIKSDNPIFGTAEGKIRLPDLLAGIDPYSKEEVIWGEDGKSHMIDGIRYRHKWDTSDDCGISKLNFDTIEEKHVSVTMVISAKRLKTMLKMVDNDTGCGLAFCATNGKKGAVVCDTCTTECGTYEGEDLMTILPDCAKKIITAMCGGDKKEFEVLFGNNTVIIIRERYLDYTIDLVIAPHILCDNGETAKRIKSQF